MQIQFKIEGQIQISRVLQGVSVAVQNWTPALEKSGEDIIEFLQGDVFESEGAAVGLPWQPLSPAYAKQKERKYPGQLILQATGLMRSSFTQVVDATSLTIGNSMAYFKYHQSNQPRTKMPRRMMLYLTENLREQVVKNFQTQLLESTNGL